MKQENKEIKKLIRNLYADLNIVQKGVCDTNNIEHSKTWVEIFGMKYTYRFENEGKINVLRFNKSVFVMFQDFKEL